MIISVNKWGNSLGIRLPNDFKQEFNLKAGSKIKIKSKNNKIIIEPINLENLSNQVDLDSLVAQVNDSNKPESEWIIDDAPKGKEIW